MMLYYVFNIHYWLVIRHLNGCIFKLNKYINMIQDTNITNGYKYHNWIQISQLDTNITAGYK